MTCIHSFNQFHAAGHGTFFSGEIIVDGDIQNYQPQRFNWVFDCGSRRSGRIPAFIDDLDKVHKVDQIDMLCISHFDADHVNGLRHLLTRFQVDTLVLPYLPLSTRLRLVSDLDPDYPGSADAMMACLDTAGFLSLRGLSNKVRRIVLVKGYPNNWNGRRGIPDGPEGLESPEIRGRDNDLPRLHLVLQASSLDEAEYSGGGSMFTQADDLQPQKMLAIEHQIAGYLSNQYWEFAFYNKSPPDGLAPRSGKTLADVRMAVRNIMVKYDLTKASDAIVEGWRDELRKCYDKHFGKGAKARNDISLCVLSRPTVRGSVEGCALFDDPARDSRLGITHQDVADGSDETGLLLTGDIGLDMATCAEMEAHFSSWRWRDIAVMQIPHHGSLGSWELGTEGACYHKTSVLCVPDNDPSGHHPDANLVLALAKRNPVPANYSSDVRYVFHVKGGFR